MLRGVLASSVLIAVTGLCLAGDEVRSDVALGLDKLKWGMKLAEVKSIYPPLKGDDGSAIRLEHYSYDGCDFDVFLEFTNDRLDSVILEVFERPAPCYLQVRKELLTQFGKPVPAETREDGRRFAWKTDKTLVWYIGDREFLHIAFEQAKGSPHHVIYEPAPGN